MRAGGDKDEVIAVKMAARAAARHIVDFALPPRCPGCGAITAEPHLFCLDCWGSIDFLGDPCCACCALPFDYDQGPEARCGACLADPPRYDSMRAAVAYGPASRRVAIRLKYSGRPALAQTMARFMRRHLPDAPDVLLTSVPLHRWRIWTRGYNQAALIAGALAKERRLLVDNALMIRTRATPPLRGMNPRQRANAVRGAFRLRPGVNVSGRRILIVDDVFTTGATAAACARVLRRAGAARVDILCWARVVPGSD